MSTLETEIFISPFDYMIVQYIIPNVLDYNYTLTGTPEIHFEKRKTTDVSNVSSYAWCSAHKSCESAQLRWSWSWRCSVSSQVDGCTVHIGPTVILCFWACPGQSDCTTLSPIHQCRGKTISGGGQILERDDYLKKKFALRKTLDTSNQNHSNVTV